MPCICSRTCSRAEKADAVRRADLSDEVAFWLYTSGSTGDPKGVKHLHTSLMATAKLMGARRRRHPRRRRGVLGGQAVLRLWPGQRHVVSAVGRRHRAYCGRSGRRRKRCSRSCAAHRPTIFYGVPSLYAAMLAHPDIGTRRRLRPPAHLRLGRRGAAGAYRRALARDRRRRRSRRHRLDRNAAHLPQQPPRRRPLRLHRQAGARLRRRASSTSTGTTCGDGRDRRTDRARSLGRRRLLEPARQEPPHLRRRMDLYRRQILPRRRRLLLLLRPHRRHVQGQRHVGVAVRGRGGAGLARGGAGSRRHRQGRTPTG